MFESVRRSLAAARRSNSLVAGAILRLMPSVLRSVTMNFLCLHCQYIVNVASWEVKGLSGPASVGPMLQLSEFPAEQSDLDAKSRCQLEQYIAAKCSGLSYKTHQRQIAAESRHGFNVWLKGGISASGLARAWTGL